MIKDKGRSFLKELFVAAMLVVLFFMPKGAIAKAGEAASETEAKTTATEVYGNIPLSFIQNNGQTDKRVRFYERGAGHATFFTEGGVYLTLVRGQGSGVRGQKKEDKLTKDGRQKADKLPADKKTLESTIVRLIPLNANPNPQIIAEAPQAGKVNYLMGNDPAKWKTNIPTYGAVVYKDLYKGIDMKFYGSNQQLEYDIIVSPGTDPSQVKLSYEGVQGLKVTDTGDLEISLKEGSIIQKRPYIYQEIAGRKVEVSGRFKIKSEQLKTNSSKTQPFNHSTAFSFGFEIASYNKDYPLIIDPVLVYSTYLGSGGNYGNSIAVDSLGNAYVTGYTTSADFPTRNPIQGAHGGSYYDTFVTKINASGSALVYSTYFGGSSDDYGWGIKVDGSGNAYVTGLTKSTNFPTQNPLQAANAGGGGDAFVTKINSAGNALVYSTYLGGASDDYVLFIAVDGSGNVYVTGLTKSTNFPTQNPLQAANAGGDGDAFVTKINASGSALVYSTYLGGSSGDYGNGTAVDSSGNAYVTGYTASTNFPTQIPIQGANAGGGDAFVTKINASGSALVYSTYLGGSYEDSGRGIAVDGSGNAYVTGYTTSTNFPTRDPIQGVFTGGEFCGDAFVTKINSAGNALVYSTYLGGSGANCGNGIAVDGSGNAYVTGYTASTDFPTRDPIQGANAGGELYGDAFVTKINSAGNALDHSTYLGGSGEDYGTGIAVDGSGNIYVTGLTKSSNFPTQNPIQGANAGGRWDVFVSKIVEQAPPPNTLFWDVPSDYWAYDYINAIYYAGITSGCYVDNPSTPQNEAAYCPENTVTRGQMAVFIVKALAQQPSATCTGTVFNDVNAGMTGGGGFCRYVEKFRELNITAGCYVDNPSTPQNEAAYCPDRSVTRAEMAVLLTRALAQQPSATCTGTVFNDVNAGMTGGEGFCRYIEKFRELNITSGCNADNPATPQNEAAYCPDNDVTRAQMAVFLMKGFLQ